MFKWLNYRLIDLFKLHFVYIKYIRITKSTVDLLFAIQVSVLLRIRLQTIPFTYESQNIVLPMEHMVNNQLSSSVLIS